MKLKELFSKKIQREINGVIKVDQVDNPDVLFQELDEFVITTELTRHFNTFFKNYNHSIDKPTANIGVWISGFFGSGKSHFLKMLSYLLENKEVKGHTAVDLFESKFKDPLMYAEVKRAVSVPTEAILFNIDSKSSPEGKSSKEGIVEIFLKVFNEKLGYCAEIPWLANLERLLDKEGNYEKFKLAFREVAGEEWEVLRDRTYLIQDEFVSALVKAKGLSKEAAENYFLNADSDYSITPESFALLIKDYIDSKGPKNRIIFLVDEIGQYISDNTSLMLNLQTVVEQLGIYCPGRAWVLVTSQEAIDTITKERFRDQDFSKIQGRFHTRLSLSGSNTDEVIRKRLLEKTTIAEKTLSQHYHDQEKILANLITFSTNTAGMKIYDSNKDFVNCYPFVPYQFKLLQDVFASLRNFSHAGAHLSENERSMLNAFHSALKEYSEKDITDLVPFNIFFSTVKTFIDTNIVRM